MNNKELLQFILEANSKEECDKFIKLAYENGFPTNKNIYNNNEKEIEEWLINGWIDILIATKNNEDTGMDMMGIERCTQDYLWEYDN